MVRVSARYMSQANTFALRLRGFIGKSVLLNRPLYNIFINLCDV